MFKVVQRVRQTDLNPKAVSNHDMGLVFKELIRRFAESSNDTAGEHFTPRDIVRLITALVFMEYVHELNPQAVMRAYGQELNPESYAICKADMLIKGQDVSNIKLGNTLSNDQLHGIKFDYMLSNSPFGVDWKRTESVIKDEHSLKGFDG